MTSIGLILAVIGGAFSLLAFVAAAYVYLRRSSDTATIESQGRLIESIQAENANLRHRVEMVEQENASLRTAVAEVKGITQLRREAAAIKSDTQAILARLA